MFKAELIAESYKNILGWRQYHDTYEFSIENDLTLTESGEYFQQKHAAMRLNYIKSILPSNLSLNIYLQNKTRDASVEIMNDIWKYRQVKDYGKTLLSQSQLLNKYGWMKDGITNESRFVGFQIQLRTNEGLQAVINKIGLQFTHVETFDLYLFHSSKTNHIKKVSVTTTEGGGWDWKQSDWELKSMDDDINGGVYVLGYYQDDIVNGNAVNNTDFNFDNGPCGGCGDSYRPVWESIEEHFLIYPLYVPSGSFVKEKMFDLRDAFFIPDTSYGLNLRLSTSCDLTNFFIENKMEFKNLLAFKVVLLILNDMKFSMETNFIEENLKSMIIRDLEGDTETKEVSLLQKYKNELKAVNFNISGINDKCLPCSDENTYPVDGIV
jgi:hypothetical protein